MDFLPSEIDHYVNRHSEKEPDVLYHLYRETHQKVLNPRMLAGHLQGRVLSMLSHMLRPKQILEVGTFTGYSSICWAEGLQKGGVIHTIDINEEIEDFTASYFEKAGVKDQIKLHIGDALTIIPQLQQPWDVVFIDADKSNYASYYDLVFDQVKDNGYIIIDNVLWSGKVTQPAENHDEDTQAIVDFNKKIQEDQRVQNVLFPIRDGLMICRKLPANG